tara:strand:+ start:3189 stop:3956 length:768 start_codon:yes stop_codon:yes gene_type:complete
MINENDYSSKVALVTGASKRIGRSIALNLARKGWKTIIHYWNSEIEAIDLINKIKSEGFEANKIKANLANSVDCQQLLKHAEKIYGFINLLINNASVFERDEIDTINEESWNKHLDINLRAPTILTQKFSEQLPIAEYGNIINIIDQRVWNLTPNFVSYSVSKSALWSLTKISSLALAPRIRINGIGPGPILPSTRQSLADFEQQCLSTPLKRGSTTKEICEAVNFILAAEGMTGQMIVLDGGAHLSWKEHSNKE